jgi:hypothetical protein
MSTDWSRLETAIRSAETAGTTIGAIQPTRRCR